MAEVKFREGKRIVPDYMALLMRGIPTHKLTYEEAIAAMNRKMETDLLDHSVDRIIARHFAENGRG